MRPGVRLGIDVGRARIGVARCDREGLLATPLETIQRSAPSAEPSAVGADVRRILELAREHDAFELVVGLPLSLSGADTASTQDARDFARSLADAAHAGVQSQEKEAGRGELAVILIDERLSTSTAQSQLRASGRRSRTQRPVIDQAAAVIILQHALDTERGTGAVPGDRVDTGKGF